MPTVGKTPDIERLVWPKHGEKLAWLDRVTTILDVVTRAGTMWLGYNAFEKTVKGSGLSGAIVSQIAMKLATSNNMASGAAGVATLSGMGLLNIYDPNVNYIKLTSDWIYNLGAATQPYPTGYIESEQAAIKERIEEHRP